jgi:hypothetical protein
LTNRTRGSRLGLVSWPRAARREDYASASEEIEASLRKLPGIIALYRTGSVSVPGISDLDRIAVVDGGAPVETVWPGLAERSRYLAMHTPFLVDHATFERHRWFAFLEPLELCFGSAVEFQERPSRALSEPLLGTESLMACLLRLVKQTSVGRLKVRQLLCELNNLRHGLALVGLTGADVPGAWAVAGDVSQVRASWFGSTEDRRAEMIRDVAGRAGPALLEALRCVGRRTEVENGEATPLRLASPWSNVALVPAPSPNGTLAETPRARFPVNRSVRLSELWWRAQRPEIPLSPAVVALLAGSGSKDREFRAERDEIVRSYRRFLEARGRGYSAIGLAMPFLPR